MPAADNFSHYVNKVMSNRYTGMFIHLACTEQGAKRSQALLLRAEC